MAAAVGVSLKRGFPAAVLGRVGLQVSPGAVVQWGAVPVTETVWVERSRRGGRSPSPGLGGGLTLHPAPEHPFRQPSDASPSPERGAAGRRLEERTERQRSGRRTSELVKVIG